MKISIITLHSIKNYGSVLQTYATQYKLEKMGFEVEFVDYWRKDSIDKNLLNVGLDALKKWNRNIITRIVYKIIKGPSIRKSCNVFNSFLKQKIKLTTYRYYSLEDIQKRLPQADIYCTGSDQMWNSHYNRGILKEYFLDYAPIGKRCIAYSTSIGKLVLDDWEKEETKLLLQKYYAISVREQSATQILEKLGINGSVHLLDPTLVLNKNDWQSVIAPRRIKDNYILIYQLNHNKNFDMYAETLARINRCKLVRIGLAYNQIVKSGKVIFLPKPEEFLSLFFYAEYIITDSFHGTAFSINFNKKFAVVYPPKFSTRLQSILELTGLTHHVLTDFNNYTTPDLSIDYGKVNRILDAERKKADDFLEKALRLENVLTGDVQ